jgi:uncharacterized membrane protein YphA (DoxX/SURF4 family)
MFAFAQRAVRWWVGPGPNGAAGHLLSRWLFLRVLGVIYFSAFYSLLFQIRGMLGPSGLLPAGSYLQEVGKAMPGAVHFWYAPTLLWFNSSNHALMALCWIGMIASLLLILNFWPRAMLLVCFIFFLSFVAAAQDFSGYQSDGMLLAAGFICLFFAPGGLRPGLGEKEPPSRATVFLLLLLWFCIYFESGVAKYFGGDPSWRDFSAMNEYYQNGPLPTWIGWYVQQLPLWFHKSTAVQTVFTEIVIVCMVFLPRVFRIACFFMVTALQVAIIATANYAFLNYLVLALGIFLLDDAFLQRAIPRRWRDAVHRIIHKPTDGSVSELSETHNWHSPDWQEKLFEIALWPKAILLAWVLYASGFLLIRQISSAVPLPAKPVIALDPFRIANSYGLFGRMTWARYEIEFQGSNDGVNWTVYPFRYKPQALDEAPSIYAPYQPRFEWNLWFASLGNWRENPWVLRAEQQLLLNNKDVLALFRANPFAGTPPTKVRAVLWQYWFTDRATKHATGNWWRREDRGLYAPALARTAEGKIIVSQFSDQNAR